MSPTAAIRAVFDAAAAAGGPAIGSAPRATMKLRDATATRIRRERMGSIVSQGARRCQSGFELGPRPFVVAVALLRERLRMDVIAPDLPEPPCALGGELE